MRKQHLIKAVTKGQIIIFSIIMCFVIISSFTFAKVVDASENKTKLDYTIVLDAGHGGLDPGSIGYKTKTPESELNLKYTLLLKQKLENAGIRVVLTRETSDGLYGISTANYKKRDMQKRKEIIEKANPNLVVSVHMNSYTNHTLRGAQVFFDGKSDTSLMIAKSIQKLFYERLPASKPEVSKGDYFMLKCSNAPAIIAECGFLSNAEDEANLLNTDYQDKVTTCIFEGIMEFISKAN